MRTWRLDNGGFFDYYKLISLFKSDNGIEVLTDWSRAEDSSIHYYPAQDGIFTPVKSSYFYSATM
jgi:hypothetical protein